MKLVCSKVKWLFFSDSQSAIHLCKNPIYPDRAKHIDVRYHFVCDVERDIIDLEKIASEFNPANMGTKCLSVENFIFDSID